MLKHLFISVLALVAFPLSILQAEGAESGWLYNSQAGVIWRVDRNGAVETTHQLPAPIEGSFSPAIAVSDDGQLIGYAVTAASGERRVVVYDADQARVRLEYAPEVGIAHDSFSSADSDELFSDDRQYFAYGYSRVAGGWRILLLDVDTGSMVSAIGEGSAWGLPEAGSPMIDEVSDDRIEFHVREPADGAPWQAYAWSLTSNVIAPEGLHYEDQVDLAQQTPAAPPVQGTPMPTVSSGVLAGSSLENSGLDPNLLINIGNSAAQPVGEGTPNAVVTLPPPSR